MDNWNIKTAENKAVQVIARHFKPYCSISGGSDSDIMLDMIYRADPEKKTVYYWIDTGLEYQATKEHLKYLENKYNIKIERVKALKPIPLCVKEYGVPFISKYVSEMISRLQKHGFEWEDKPLSELLQKYDNCKEALQWWCNEIIRDNVKRNISFFSINRNKWLKEFMIQNPPDFKISAKCCDYSKKLPAHNLIKQNYADCEIVGVRKNEGGVRAIAYDTCFTKCDDESGCDHFRPLFWLTDTDKTEYEEEYSVTHSKCYTKYRLKRTGCTGCPYSLHINDELAVIERFEPKLYAAAVNIFGKSYEYTRKYREFAAKMRANEKEEKAQCEGQLRLE